MENSHHEPRFATATTTAPFSARWLSLGAVAGPLLFACAWIVLGFLSPGYSAWGQWIGPYSAVHQPISGLGLGMTGPFMNAAFVLSGLLLVAGVAGSFRGLPEATARARWISGGLLALSGVGAMMCGLFTLESFLPHLVGFVLAVGAPMLGFMTTSLILRRIPRWRRFGNWLLVGSPLTVALLALFFSTFDATTAGSAQGIGGLSQRLLVAEVHAWYVAFGWLAWRRS
jgi:hypothetical membrane protein